MVTIAFRFPAGRYHSTPWSRHVNERDVEWPPSPWRILRALIAAWHRKANGTTWPDELLGDLIHALAGALPGYRVPEGIHSHARHYMPVRSGRTEKSGLIYDAFVRVDPQDRVEVIWEHVELNDEQARLLDTLLNNMGYLGSAESWVEARRLDQPSSETLNCVPFGTQIAETATVSPLIAPRTPDGYAAWRNGFLEGADYTNSKGKKRRTLDMTLPPRLIDALAVETGDLHEVGWSHPPAARSQPYLRAEHVLRPHAGRRRKRRQKERLPNTARIALTHRPLARFEDAIKVGEHTRKAVMGRAGQVLGKDKMPPVFSGRDVPSALPHQHAFWLPEDADEDGYIDHVLVYAPMGFNADARRVFDQLRTVKGPHGEDWCAIVENVCDVEKLSESSRLVGPSKEWVSATPYLHPWHRKRYFGVEDQIRREVDERGNLPELMDLQPLENNRIPTARGPRRPVQFHRFRSARKKLKQPDTGGSAMRLVFAQPISGPVALGFGCHFGLGEFVVPQGRAIWSSSLFRSATV